MGKRKSKLKRLAALWLSIAMLFGSIYTSSNYSSLADQTGLKLLESFKAENSKGNGSSDSSNGITSVKATAADSDEIGDGDVIDDTATNSDADGDVSTASNANAISIASLTSSTEKLAIATSPNSYIKLFEDMDTAITDPSEFAIGKYGTKTMKIDFRFDPTIDIPEGQRVNVGGEVVVPKGFTVDETTLESDDNWVVTSTTNEDGDTVLVYKSQNKLVFLRQTLLIEQDAQYLINNLSTINEYKFALKLYINYGEDNQKLIVESDADDETASFSFELDDTEPSWDIEVANNGYVYKPADFTTYNSSAADNANKSFSTVRTSTKPFESGIVVRYHKTKGYMTDDTIFRVMTESLPRSTSSGNQTYQVYIRYIDVNGNVINLPLSTYTYYNYITSVVNGEYKLQAAEISNKSTTELVKEFQVLADSSPSNSTYGDILYNEGTLEIKVLPNILYNKLFYDNDWDENARITFTSDYPTAVVNKNGEVLVNGDPITINIENGTEDQIIDSASASALDGASVMQYKYGTAYNYFDTVAQTITITYNKQTVTDWKVYDDFVYTIEYNGENRYGEALTPIKLEGLTTGYEYGLTYRIYIRNAANDSERIETIVGMKNSTEPYPYTPSNAETVIGNGLKTWNSDGDRLSGTEYVYKIEIVKDKASAGKFRTSTTLGTTTLRAQHYKIDGSSENIPDGTKVQLKTTVKTGNTTYGPFIQNITTVENMEHLGDSLELATASVPINIQVNHATKDTGILGTYTLRKYLLTMDYDVDDPPVVVLSGDGATLTDRVSATNQKLLYIIGVDENNDEKFYDVSDSGTGTGTVKASDHLVKTRTAYVKYGSDSKGYSNYPYYIDDLEHIPYLPTGTSYSSAIDAHRNTGTEYDEDLYNLTDIYDELGIKYATKLVLSQDWVNDWSVTDNETGAVKTKCFYANKIEPGYLNYDNIVNIDGKNNIESVSLSYSAELYCKASEWLAEKNGSTYIDSNGGSHGSRTSFTQNSTNIVYGKNENLNVSSINSFCSPSLNSGRIGKLASDRENGTGNLLAQVYTSTETTNGLYMDYDNVTYDFEGTDPQLLSITTGVGIYIPSSQVSYLVDIEYTTSDGETHNYKTVPFYLTGNYSNVPGPNDHANQYIPLKIEEGTYVTGIKVRTSNEDYIWSDTGSYMNKNQPKLPTVTLCRAGGDAVMPAYYPSSGKKVGYQGKTNSAGRVYDTFDVKCTLSYNDIFGNTTTTTAEGLSAACGRSSYNVGYTGVGSSRGQYGYTDKVTYDVQKINRGAVLTATINPDIYLSYNVYVGTGSALRLRPVFYLAIDKDFTPDTSNITGLKGASAVFYPAGTGNGYSGSDEYGYLVIDTENVAESDLPSSTYNSQLIDNFRNHRNSKWSYGAYTIPLITAYDANEGVSKTPIKHIWTDVPHDSGRDGSSGNYLANIGMTSVTAGAPDIVDSTGKHISTLQLNSSGVPVMLYRDLANATGNQVVINTLDKGGMVPYVTENITGGMSQDNVNGRDFTELDKSNGLFGNKIYLVGNSTKILADFDIYIPVPKKDESNMADGGDQSEVSDFGLKYMGVDTSELKKVATGVTVSYTTDPNPGANGYTSMAAAKWLSDTPSDASKISGIKVHLDELSKGARPYFTVQYQLDGDKIEIGELKAYQTFYCNYKTDSQPQYTDGYTNPTVAEYILEDMSISGVVWDESGKTPNSVYDKGVDSPLKDVTIRLYKKDGTEIEQTNSTDYASNTKFKTAEDGTYELVAPSDGEFIVGITKQVNDGENWQLVKMLEGTVTNIKSYGNPTTSTTSGGTFSAKTNVLYFETDYAQGKYTLSNINFGLYRMAKLADMDDAMVHVGDVATSSKALFDGYTMSLGEDYAVKFGTPSDADIVKLTDNHDNSARLEGLKAGKTKVDVSITDMYGNSISGKINIVSYINVIYDVTTNGGTGTVSDATKYYLDEYANATPDMYTVKDGSGVIPPIGFAFAGWSTNKDSDKDSCDKVIGQTYSITETDMKSDITLYAIYAGYDVTYKIEYYRQVPGKTAGIESSYEHYIGGDTISGDTLATGSSASKVKAPAGYETKFGDEYKVNATLSNAELEQTIAGDGTTVVKLYYDIDYKDINWYDIEQDPPIKKAISSKNGKLPNAEQEFIFTMTGRNGAPLPDARDGETSYDEASNTLTAKLSTKDALKGIEFGNIAFDFDDVGETFEYVIKEVPQDIKNFAFDDIATGENGYTMTVTIGIDGTKLTKEVTYGGGGNATEDGIIITNTYTASSNNSGGGGSSGGSGSSTGKHAVNPINAENTDETNTSKNQTTLVEPKPDDSNYKNWVWGLMPKTGEEAARMGALLLSIAGLVAILVALVARRKQKE